MKMFIQNVRPFCKDDITVGVENELQTAVIGTKEKVDLPQTIYNSNYYKNIVKRALSGDTSTKNLLSIERFINENQTNVWENSWIKFPENLLSTFAKLLFYQDILADKNNPNSTKRSDYKSFTFNENGYKWLRIPMSYMFKLALADSIGQKSNLPQEIIDRAIEMMIIFQNDNTSPEVISFSPITQKNGFIGKEVATETAKRFLLIQLLNLYATQKWELKKFCGEPQVYFSPIVPTRQQQLNEIISDSFYRELFMSPCLSGWAKGEEKKEYMHLCHKVLSLSHLNILKKLKNSGILNNNLIILPNTSNVSLGNNGTHVSLGSKYLTSLLKQKSKNFTIYHEKYYGDLAIKIIEHFIPLFIDNFSASPKRFGFTDFHPERILGFLAHELDYTHLRMLWRVWKKKARLKLFGKIITPFGPDFLDNLIGKICNLKGDFVPDYRLIDYLVTLSSTNSCPALDGTINNQEKLKNDLSDMGVFDKNMSFYLLYKLREFKKMGFTGFEGRFYSQFDSFTQDFAPAVELQTFLTCFAYQLIINNQYSHLDIPDDITVESERRQFIFGSSVSVHKLFVNKKTNNKFLLDILSKINNIKSSKRYPGYFKVPIENYKLALLKFIEDKNPELIEEFNIKPIFTEIKLRTKLQKQLSVSNKLVAPMLKHFGTTNTYKISPYDFNSNIESYYRNELRIKQTLEAFELFKKELFCSFKKSSFDYSSIIEIDNLSTFLNKCSEKISTGNLCIEEIIKLIYLVIISTTSSIDTINYKKGAIKNVSLQA